MNIFEHRDTKKFKNKLTQLIKCSKCICKKRYFCLSYSKLKQKLIPLEKIASSNSHVPQAMESKKKGDFNKRMRIIRGKKGGGGEEGKSLIIYSAPAARGKADLDLRWGSRGCCAAACCGRGRGIDAALGKGKISSL